MLAIYFHIAHFPIQSITREYITPALIPVLMQFTFKPASNNHLWKWIDQKHVHCELRLMHIQCEHKQCELILLPMRITFIVWTRLKETSMAKELVLLILRFWHQYMQAKILLGFENFRIFSLCSNENEKKDKWKIMTIFTQNHGETLATTSSYLFHKLSKAVLYCILLDNIYVTTAGWCLKAGFHECSIRIVC